jgi:hypothetical protein
MVDYEKTFKKPFTDLVKLVVGIVLSIIPIVSWLAKGFAIESSGLGKAKPSDKMPEWKNWGHLFIRGLLSDIIFFVYALPAIIVILLGLGVAIFSLVGGVMSPAIMNWFQGSSISQNWMTILPTLVVAAPILLVGIILLLLASYAAPMAVMNYVRKDKFAAAFEFKTVSKKIFTGEYFVVWLIATIATVIISVILSLIPIIGQAIAAFITAVISYSLYGQIYKEA